jgi:hypothetical protein
MRVLISRVVVAGLGLGLVSCDDNGDDPMDGVVDNRVVLPDDDPDHHVFLGGEIVIAPGEDKMYCFHSVVEEDMALREIEMLQGDFGHHAVMVSSTDPLPPGSVQDCSDDASSAKLKAAIIPFGDEAPENWAMWIKAGTPLVLQSHYVNASDEPILVRDAVRARRVDPGTVSRWVSPFTTTAMDLDIPATEETYERTFDCIMDRDVDLMYIGGHMHEQGSSFEVQIGSNPDTEPMEQVYNVERWIPEFRDLPPVELRVDNLLRLEAGSTIRTTCRWENRTGIAMGFPEEMCVTFGIIVGTKEDYDCRVGN